MLKNPVDFESLKKVNEDIIGWIRVNALDISYPIAQSTNNDYYLHRTFERVDNFAGCIFMEYQNHSDFSDKNTIIYGHNMKNGSMFGTLRKFYEDEVYEKAPYFWIYTPDKIYRYDISPARRCRWTAWPTRSPSPRREALRNTSMTLTAVP